MRRSKRSNSRDAVRLSKHALKTIKCSTHGCHNEERVDSTTESVVCWECVQKKVGIDKRYLQRSQPTRKLPEGFPRGWHLYKQFVHSDGRVFEKGKEVPNLKGTLPPTQVKVNTLTKYERRAIRDAKKARREARLAKKYEKKMRAKRKETTQ